MALPVPCGTSYIYIFHSASSIFFLKWVPWPEIVRLTSSVIEYLETLLASPPASMNVTENKKMQRALQLVMYVLIPPLRNNFANLRLITPDQETLDVLKESNSPNYIVVNEGGFATLVINKFKIDGRSTAMDYDPAVDFQINHPRTERFELSRPEPVLTKFGLDPQRLANILTGYHNLQDITCARPTSIAQPYLRASALEEYE
jgi:hypothetical protein